MNNKVSGTLFITAGVLFFATAVMVKQIAFYGIAAAFVCIGIVFLSKTKKN